MFKEKAAKLLKSNSELINASDLSEFSIEELEKTGIHPAFIKYLWAEKIPSSNGENDGQFLFSKNEINIGLKKAAVFNLNFLFNPVFLLKKILFVKDKPINEESFEDLKNRVYYFRYYIDILIKLYKSDKLNSESYDETMSKIQKKLFSVNYNSLITDGVDALNHFFNHGEHYSGLDPECMKLFLLSRDLKDSFDKLIPHYNGKDQLSIWKIKDVLTGSEESVFDARFDITREIKTQSATRPSLKTDVQEIKTPEEGSGVSEVGVQNNNQSFEASASVENEKKTESVETKNSTTGVTNSKPKMASISVEELISQPRKKIEFESVDDEVKQPFEVDEDAKQIIATLPSIHDMEAIKVFEDEPVQRYEFSFPPKVDEQMGKIVQKRNLLASLDQDESLRIIQHVFDGDHSDFFSSIETIEKCRTLSEAKKLLSIIFANAGLSDNNKYARLLVDKTERCFTG
ncbi:MAG: hypothetical protein IPN18_07270 [Ignavibacteriales bacterium]|nr:hypothetical protein [Ignavibacteriales bacterium]